MPSTVAPRRGTLAGADPALKCRAIFTRSLRDSFRGLRHHFAHNALRRRGHQLADQALYRAKREGRDRVVSAQRYGMRRSVAPGR